MSLRVPSRAQRPRSLRWSPEPAARSTPGCRRAARRTRGRARPGLMRNGFVDARLVHLSAPLSVPQGILLGELVRLGGDRGHFLPDAVKADFGNPGPPLLPGHVAQDPGHRRSSRPTVAKPPASPWRSTPGSPSPTRSSAATTSSATFLGPEYPTGGGDPAVFRLAIATGRSVVAQAPTRPELSEVMAHYP